MFPRGHSRKPYFQEDVTEYCQERVTEFTYRQACHTLSQNDDKRILFIIMIILTVIDFLHVLLIIVSLCCQSSRACPVIIYPLVWRLAVHKLYIYTDARLTSNECRCSHNHLARAWVDHTFCVGSMWSYMEAIWSWQGRSDTDERWICLDWSGLGSKWPDSFSLLSVSISAHIDYASLTTFWRSNVFIKIRFLWPSVFALIGTFRKKITFKKHSVLILREHLCLLRCTCIDQ